MSGNTNMNKELNKENIINYREDSQLLENLSESYIIQEQEQQKQVNLQTILINGYIYRGDNHKNFVLTNSPKFYGTYETSLMYTPDGDYLKRYTTLKSLRLLNLSNDNKNTTTILKFLKETVLMNTTDNDSIMKIKMTIILVQVLFGMIVYTLDKMQLSDEDISDFLEKQKISGLTTALFLKVVNDLQSKYSSTIPSRCSMRPLDKLLMKLFREILVQYEIDGTFYVQGPEFEKQKKIENLLCNKVDKNYEYGTTCVPSEICIFNPDSVLGSIKFWKKVDGQLIKVNIKKKLKSYVKHNYNTLSTIDIYLLSKLYQNKKKIS